MSPHYKVRTVAELLDCTRAHVYNLIKRGQLQAVKGRDGTIRVPEESVEAFFLPLENDDE